MPPIWKRAPLLPFLMLALSGSAFAAPTIGTPLELDVPVRSPLPWEQHGPAVASDGAGFLAAWTDSRRGGVNHLFATRIDASGTLLDPAGFQISSDDSGQTPPVVAYGSGVYLVVWSTADGSGLRAARVSGSTVMDPDGINVGGLNPRDAAVGFDGTNFLVVWSGPGANGSDLYAVQVSPETGTVGTTFTVSNATGSQVQPSVGCDGSQCLVVWRDQRGSNAADLYGTRVSKSGVVLDGAGTGIRLTSATTDEIDPSVSFGSGTFLVGYSDGSSLRFVEVATNGTPGTDAAIAGTTGARAPSVTFNGTDFVICALTATGASGQVRCDRVSPSGSLFPGTEWTRAANDPGSAVVAAGGGTSLVVWDLVGPFTDTDVHAARLDATGAMVGPELVLSVAANIHDQPAIGFGADEYLVAWSDYRNGGDDLYAARLDSTGTKLDDVPVQLSKTPGTQWESEAAIGFGDGVFLVAWVDSTQDERGALISADGQVVKTDFLLAEANGPSAPAVTFDGTRFLVVFSDTQSDASGDIMAVRVDTSGTVLGAPFAIAAGPDAQTAPSAAFDGQQSWIVFTERAAGAPSHLSIVQVPSGGTPSAEAPLLTLPSAQTGSAIDCGGGTCFVTWLDDRGGGGDVYGTRLDANGAALDPSGIAIGVGASASRARVRYTGTSILVAWRSTTSGQDEIRGATVDSTGALIDSGLFFNSSPAADGRVALASDGQGGAMLAYERFVDSPGFQVNRTAAQTVTFEAPQMPPPPNDHPPPVTPDPPVTPASTAKPLFLTVACTSAGAEPLLGCALLWLGMRSRIRRRRGKVLR